nr:unnamed protein product [Callosobruchus chinensis]
MHIQRSCCLANCITGHSKQERLTTFAYEGKISQTSIRHSPTETRKLRCSPVC